MSESRDYLEMTFRSIECFSNDGKLDANELGKILRIAEKDGEIDQNEVRVLRNIISKIKPHEVDEDMKTMLQNVSSKINA
jgi:Ca2+-binding EF-hand superfamily protein